MVNPKRKGGDVMAEIQGDSPHAVAYAMMRDIALLEGKPVNDRTKGADRAYVLKLYKDCLDVVLTYRRWGAYTG
jgi:hypothetical protein